MSARKPDLKKLQAACDAFNAACEVGGAVLVMTDGTTSPIKTVTASEAQVLSAHSAVVWLKGISGCYLLDRVTPISAPAALMPIGPVPVARDESGWWAHPGIPEFDEGQEDEYRTWLKVHLLEIKYSTLEDENDTHPVHIAYFDDGSGSVIDWNPSAPTGEGWFTISIHDTDGGPYWVWARRITDVADQVLAAA